MADRITRGFFQVTLSGAGNNLARQKQFTKRLQKKVGQVYSPGGSTDPRRQIILAWASCSHQPALLGLGGTSRYIIITKRNRINPPEIRGFFRWLTRCNNVFGITLQVEWMGDDAEKDLIAPGTLMYPATGELVDRAIHHRRKQLAEWGDPGTFFETDGSNATQNPSPTGLYPPLECNGRAPGQMGGYVGVSCGRMHVQDTLTPTQFLTNEQIASANNPTRGLPRQEYEAWQTRVRPECVALIASIPYSLTSLASTNRPSRDDVELIKSLGDTAVNWRKDMGEAGKVVDVTVEPRSVHNSEKWTTLGEIVLPGEQTLSIGPTDSSENIWTNFRAGAGAGGDPAYDLFLNGMAAPDGSDASNAQGMVIALTILARDLQSRFGNPGCHVHISNEHSANGSSHSSLLTIVRGNDIFEITRWINYRVLQLGLLPKYTGTVERMRNLNITSHIRIRVNVDEIHKAFKYHNKVPNFNYDTTNKRTLRAHHRNVGLPRMSGNAVVLFTGNYHPLMRHQVMRRYQPSFDGTTLTRSNNVSDCRFFIPLPVGHPSIMARIEPTERDWQQALRRERTIRDEEIVARERSRLGGMAALIRRFEEMFPNNPVAQVRRRTDQRPSTAP